MILTCPECATRYFIDDARLGASGRTVRCASCGSAWRAHFEEPLELTTSPEEGAVARVAGEPLSFKPPETQSLADTPLAEVAAPELGKAFRAKAEEQRQKRKAITAGVVWGVMGAGFLGILGAAYVFRVEVVRLYPSAAGAYAMAGAPVNPTGLKFEKVSAAAAPDGVQSITVSATVRNIEGRPALAPPIRVSLLDKSGHRIATQIVKLTQTSMGPGQTQMFSVALPDPRGATADVGLDFALDLAPKPPSATKAKPKVTVAQTRAPALSAEAARLRPAMGVEAVTAEEAKPIGPEAPYALDTAAPKAVSAARHG